MTTKSKKRASKDRVSWSEAYSGSIQTGSSSNGEEILIWLIIPLIIAGLIIVYALFFETLFAINTLIIIGSMLTISAGNLVAIHKYRKAQTQSSR